MSVSAAASPHKGAQPANGFDLLPRSPLGWSGGGWSSPRDDASSPSTSGLAFGVAVARPATVIGGQARPSTVIRQVRTSALRVPRSGAAPGSGSGPPSPAAPSLPFDKQPLPPSPHASLYDEGSSTSLRAVFPERQSASFFRLAAPSSSFDDGSSARGSFPERRPVTVLGAQFKAAGRPGTAEQGQPEVCDQCGDMASKLHRARRALHAAREERVRAARAPLNQRRRPAHHGGQHTPT